jgi:hypothetical protein
MPHPFKAYEIEVLQLLLANEFSREELSQLLEEASTQRVEYTNYGFYISVEHPRIGETRRVHGGPTTLSGRSDSHIAGFVVFLENNKLTLEIFPWDGEALPVMFRDSDVQIVHEVPSQKI